MGFQTVEVRHFNTLFPYIGQSSPSVKFSYRQKRAKLSVMDQSSIDHIRFVVYVYFPNSNHTRIQIICHLYKFTNSGLH